MKLAPLLLAASLIANAVLVAVVLKQPDAPTAAPAASSAATRAAPGSVDKSSDPLRAALASGDVAALEKAGVAPEVARQLVLGRALARFAEKMRGHQSTDGKWWRNRGMAGAREDTISARREISDALIAAFGDDFGMSGADAGALAFLSPEKRAALRRVTQDYAEMEAKFSASGIQLPSDRERLKLLRAERDRDIAALLTPAELADYELRTSNAAAGVRARYGDAIETEDEFRRIVALQKAFDEKFPRDAFQGRVTPELMQQRAAADRQLQDDIRAAIGDDRYAALRRASDTDLRNVDSLAQRLNLPADTGDRVAKLRDNYAAESQRISANTALTPQQRRDEIQGAAIRARTEVLQAMPGEAGEAYLQRAPWLSMLQGGIAFSTNPKDAPTGAIGGGGQSVFPVIPAGVNMGAPGATRQVVNIVNTSGGPTDGGGLFFAPAAPVRSAESMQVISIGSSGTTTSSNQGGGSGPGTAPATNQPTPTPRP